MSGTVEVFAPGRVNLIGDHTDYTGGLAMPMAIQRGTTITGTAGGDSVQLDSVEEAEAAVVPLHVDDPAAVTPGWARYVAGVVAELEPEVGFTGEVRSTLPIGRGLSSSASLEVAVALALGAEGSPLEIAQLCQRAEQRSSGVPCGLMDQLTCTAGVEGHALLMDFTGPSVEPVPLPDGVDVVVVDSGQQRGLDTSAYGERRAECEAAEHVLGPLRSATPADAETLRDPVLRRRARHVTSENQRVLRFADALRAGDLHLAGDLMVASHQSLRDDFEVSTPVLDTLVERLSALAGVHGARLTGAGFGGCVVVLAERDTSVDGWRVTASGPAHRRTR